MKIHFPPHQRIKDSLSRAKNIPLINSCRLSSILILNLSPNISEPCQGQYFSQIELTSYLGFSSLASTCRPAWLPGSVRTDWIVPTLSEVLESGPCIGVVSRLFLHRIGNEDGHTANRLIDHALAVSVLRHVGAGLDYRIWDQKMISCLVRIKSLTI